MSAKIITIADSHVNQRIDNFLTTELKGVPHSRIYRALRKGEVRVNKGRIKATYRLQLGDQVRIPPIRVAERSEARPSDGLIACLKQSVIVENEDFIIINKPAGLAVHGGSEIRIGVIEAFRQMRPDCENLSLVHRLDRETSGCLLLSKNRATLLALQDEQKLHRIDKHYLLLVKGVWEGSERSVTSPLLKQQLQGGERMVIVDEAGKSAETIFEPVKKYREATLLRAKLITGRTHQIRVHAAHLGHPIVGDQKYGDAKFNQHINTHIVHKRLFLHAETLSFKLHGMSFSFEAPLDEAFTACLTKLAE